MWKKFKKAVKKVWNTVKKVVRTLRSAFIRLAGIVDFFASWLGIQPKKYLRLQVYVLSENGKPVMPVPLVNQWVGLTRQILLARAKIEIVAPQPRVEMVLVINEKPPDEALVIAACSFGNSFSDAADWFEDHCTYAYGTAWSPFLDSTGHGAPLYAFIVKRIEGGDGGCAFPAITDYCLIGTDAKTTALAHEIGHLCWLFHRDQARNLMTPTRGDRDSELTQWQASWLRTSPHVTFWRTYP